LRAYHSRIFRFRFAIALACGAGIVVLSLMPAASMPTIPLLGWDKLQHATAYAVLTFLVGRAFDVLTPASFHGWRVGALVAVMFGGVMEILQRVCTTTRSADVYDLLADACGAVTIIVVVALFRRTACASERRHVG